MERDRPQPSGSIPASGGDHGASQPARGQSPLTERRGTASPARPRNPESRLRPLKSRSNHVLPAAVIVSGILHMVAFTFFLMHPIARQKPIYKEPLLVKLIELPQGRGGVTTGTPGRTPDKAPPKAEEPPKPKEPKTTLPGKTTPTPKEGPSAVKTETPGQAAGLGHGGQAGLGGKGAGVILDEPTFQYEWYKARLEDLLRAHWRKPVLAGLGNISASVHFTITSTGSALDIQIVSSSGNTVFDQSVIRAVYDSVPFPKFPPQYEAPQLGVLYTFELLPDKP
jgi:TonB family protein